MVRLAYGSTLSLSLISNAVVVVCRCSRERKRRERDAHLETQRTYNMWDKQTDGHMEAHYDMARFIGTDDGEARARSSFRARST
jgi:hypothetical protein